MKFTPIRFLSVFFLTQLLYFTVWGSIGPDDDFLFDNPSLISSSQDTIPIRDRYGDFITEEYYNPFDILPSNIEQTVEYDFETGNYVVMEKIGEEYYRTPTYLTMSEYLQWQQKKQEKEYFRKLSGITSPDFSKSLKLDPMSEIDIESQLLDRLFGGSEITIEPTGNVDLTFGVDFQILEEGPNITERNRRTGGFDFDMDINMGVEGKIGEKLNLGFNYNTEASFDFDNRLNLGYLPDVFDEDDIIKSIEAGNVSLPLNSQLIKGSQNLFGLKTELQFGKFFVTGIASQSRSEPETISLENGKLIQEFELRPDDYDENRHFFISHYNRELFESALSTSPQVRSLMRITNIEVWVTSEENQDLRNSSIVAAISYLGESDLANFSDQNTRWLPQPITPILTDVDGNHLPENDNSELFRNLVNDDDTRKIINTTTNLQNQYGLTQVRDFEVQSMRQLNSSEFTYYPELGFVSLNIRLRPSQVLGVAFEYTYSLNGNEVYKVGELTNESNTGGVDNQGLPEPEDVIYVKMLKRTIPDPSLPSWDLMMKNIYSLSTSQLTQEDFELDIFFEDNTTSTLKRFIPEPGFDRTPLLNFFNLDRLNSLGDPQPDGVFDFVPGVTVNTRTGSIIFPVLEPFGNSLFELLDRNDELYEKYGFPELYGNTLTQAREALDKNRFVIKGELKSNSSSEISLGSFNIPQGSVTVRAGSQILREGVDYDIDYGIGRIKILNEAYIQQGVPIRVSFEDQNLFGLQQKTMFGLRGEYRFSDDLILGGTYMRLFERPFTQKVNLGDDPINNRMFGLDLNMTKDAPFLTTLVDAIPFISTSEKSSISVSAEVAAIKPGHSGAINVPGEDQGVVSLDDFEGASSGIPLGSTPNAWVLSSTPFRYPESARANDLSYGVNRALLNWYVVNDRRVRTSEDQADPYTRLIDQDELFDRQVEVSQIPDLLTFDLSFYPNERGPYNFDLPDGVSLPDGKRSAGVTIDSEDGSVILNEPSTRWGGIMRYLDNNNDFEAANYEYIEFWMLNPYMERRDGGHAPRERGRMIFNLGSVSEDILKDNLQFYENSIPIPGETIPVQPTKWANVPLSIPNINGFDRSNTEIQDQGFDGLTDQEERQKFEEYLSAMPSLANIQDDPANDNFISYLNQDLFQNEDNLLNRFKRFNHPQNNVSQEEQRIGLGNPFPDTEDLNGNRSLDQSEAYYEYVIPLINDNGELAGENFITDERVIRNPTSGAAEKWYRFRIPINNGTPVNGIQGFRSIQFIRMYFEGFETPKTFRLAEFELVRNQWRRLPIDEDCLGDVPAEDIEFVADEVGIQENANKQPFNYVLPRGIKQEKLFSTFSNILQDENAINLRVCNLPDSCEAMIYKLTKLDIRLFERMQMFVHAEALEEEMKDGDISVFIRLGRDFNNNYYEYEVPLTLSDSVEIQSIDKTTNLQAYSDEVWRSENKLDFPLTLFTDAKKERNASGSIKTNVYTLADGDPNKPQARVKIKGNPSLGYIKGMIIGIRNNKQTGETACAEVWVNELRLQGLSNQGGVAGIARIDMQLADFGNLTMSGNYNSVGWGQIDQQLQERRLDKLVEYDIATNLELGKFFPSTWGIRIPFYFQYAKSTISPKYDPYELDLTVKELLEDPTLTDPQIQDIKDRSKDQTSIRTFNFTNVRKDRTGAGSGSPKPWDIENFSASYAFTRTKHSDAILKEEVTDDQRGDLSYAYTRRSEPIQPFKNVGGKALRFIKEFNFNPLPNGFSFNTQMRRYQNRRTYRIPNPEEEGIVYAFDNQRFDWTRNYSVQWDLAKSLKINYDATALAAIDELRQVGVAPTAEERNWQDQFGSDVDENGELYNNLIAEDPGFVNRYRRNNIKDFGRLKNYNQGLSINYTLPFKYLPGLEWITARAQYNADYTWTAGSLSLRGLLEPQIRDTEDPWNIIQNSQTRSINSTFAFDKLYDMIPYLSKINKGRRASSNRTRNARRSTRPGEEATAEEEGKREKKDREPSVFERILIRPLLALREVRLTYRENLSTVIPGFKLSPKYFGLVDGAPGWGFVFGVQPNLEFGNNNSWLSKAEEKNWITPSRFQNQQVLQNSTQNYEARIKIEPWADFDIDINFKKTYTKNHAEDFINVGTVEDPNFEQRALRDIGSYEITYSALNTLFDNDITGIFDRFEAFRPEVSNLLENDPDDPGAAHSQDQGYSKGYGRQQVEVIVPAFLAAYTGKNLSEISLDFTNEVSSRGFIPKPNWQLNYNGLSKLPWFKDIFSSISLSHGYTSTLSVSRFSTDLQYKIENPYFIDPDISTGNYFARFEIPEVIISERFQPIIGIDVKTQSNLNLNFEYAKSRNLQLSTGLGQLTEGRSTEYTAGMGWTFDDVNIKFLTGDRGRSRSRTRRPADEPEPPIDQTADDPRKAAETFERKLELNFNFSLRDDVTYIYDLDSGADPDATRGTYSLQISPAMDYDINKHFTLRAFVDYSFTRPQRQDSYVTKNIRGGITARFNLN